MENQMKVYSGEIGKSNRDEAMKDYQEHWKSISKNWELYIPFYGLGRALLTNAAFVTFRNYSKLNFRVINSGSPCGKFIHALPDQLESQHEFNFGHARTTDFYGSQGYVSFKVEAAGKTVATLVCGFLSAYGGKNGAGIQIFERPGETTVTGSPEDVDKLTALKKFACASSTNKYGYDEAYQEECDYFKIKVSFTEGRQATFLFEIVNPEASFYKIT